MRDPLEPLRPRQPVTAVSVNPNILSAADVDTAIKNAAAAVQSPLAIAVTDRQGNILAVYRKANAPATAIGNFSATVDANELAVALARTAGFFSNDQVRIPFDSSVVFTFRRESCTPALPICMALRTPIGAVRLTRRFCPA